MKRKIEAELLRWKQSPERQPLILDGARQVGKTYSLLKFANEHYKNHVHVNLDINSRLRALFMDDIESGYVVKLLEAEAQERILPEETLIILDEIQASPRALAALKYFCEDRPEYHVAAAGSLLGVAVNRESYSFPVGKVKTLRLFPLDFEEYLAARGEFFLIEEIKKAAASGGPLAETLHLRAVGLYLEYLIIGGMPAAVNAVANGAGLREIPELQAEIMDHYLADMAKYATPTESVRIRACYESLPAQLAKENRKFQYKVVQKGGSAALFGASIDWLRFAGVVLKCQLTEQGRVPIVAYADLSAFKLYFSDVGLLTMKTQLPHSLILSGARSENAFLGPLAENYVAQQLAAQGYDLFYWASNGRAELDFVIQSREKMLAIEVKKGLHTRSKSLNAFLSRYPGWAGARLSLKNFGGSGGVRAIPLYALFCL
ncbi:MAG: ATP-binding protein [Gracilibacteraceae bacterium]|nr:ATP-binding protein [Gracilibacteraceae bacterium]